MRIRNTVWFKVLLGGLISLVLVGIAAAALPLVKNWLKPGTAELRAAGERDEADQLRLVGAGELAVPPEVAKHLGIQLARAKQATRSRPLPPLAGTLALDPDRLARVHSRFAGEVVEIGQIAVKDNQGFIQQPTAGRPLTHGDRVEKFQLLAVVWSKDLGEKKSELVDAVSRLRLDQGTLDRYQDLYTQAAIPERTLREAQRNVEADQIAVARAERTLRSWRLTEAEIDAIKAEADRLRDKKAKRDKTQEEEWARVEVRAPLAGTILEKNIVPGDMVDTTTDLFKIGDLTRLSVWAHAYEEDLPELQKLPQPIPWTIQLKADPKAKELEGSVDKIGDIIDPNQHTAMVHGRVKNPDGRMRAGQFITATIQLLPSADEVEIPTAALVEDGRESVVFVQTDPDKPQYQLRRVAVARRYHDVVYVRGKLEAKDEKLGLKPLHAGEAVVIAGAVELKSALEELQAKAKTEKTELAGP